MSQFDIMPRSAAEGGHEKERTYRMGGGTTSGAANTSWQRGEVLILDPAAGDVNTAPDGASDPTSAANIPIIAAASSAGLIETEGGTSGAASHRIMTPCYDFDSAQAYVTRNVFNGNDTNIGPGGSNAMTGVFVGVTCGLWRDNTATGQPDGVNGTFGIDIGGSGFKVSRILDSLGRDTATSGQPADLVEFERITVGSI